MMKDSVISLGSSADGNVNGHADANGSSSAWARVLDARLAQSTLFQPEPHVHTVPSTSNCTILGFYSFGFCCILLMGIFTGWIGPENRSLVYCYAITFAGLGQIITGLLEYSRKSVFGANAFLTYGLFFTGYSLQGILIATGVLKASPKGEQMAFILWGCVTFLFWIQTLVINFALSALFLTVAILFWVIAAEQTNSELSRGAGWYGVFCGLIAWYLATAIFFKENMGREVLPLGHFHWAALKSKRRLGPVGTRLALTGDPATNV